MTPTTHDELLQALADLHEIFPDWRFGQMVASLAIASGATEPWAIWDLEDDQLLAAARRLIERNCSRLYATGQKTDGCWATQQSRAAETARMVSWSF